MPSQSRYVCGSGFTASRNLALSIPANEKITEYTMRSSSGVSRAATPAPRATLACPDASITTSAKTACLPSLLSTITPRDRVTVHDRGDNQGVKHRSNGGLSNEIVGHEFEYLAVETLTGGLGFVVGGACLGGPPLELTANALGIDGLIVAIPRESLHPHSSDVAAETAESFEQDHRHTDTPAWAAWFGDGIHC